MPGKLLGPGRQIDSQDNQASVSRFAGQTETQDSRPYAPHRVTGWDGGQKHNLILHAGSGRTKAEFGGRPGRRSGALGA
jgi:hypothetical protein